MKHVLLSLFLLGGVLYPAYLFFAADDQPKLTGASISGASAAFPAVPKIAALEEDQAAEEPAAAGTMEPPAAHSRHAITVEQPPSRAPAGTLPQAEAGTPPQAAAATQSQTPAESQSQAPAAEPPAPKSGAAAPPGPSAEASPGTASNQAEFMKVTSPASVSDGPSVSSAILGIAQPGAEDQVVSRESDWVQIIDPGSKKIGWIHQSFLQPQAQATSQPASKEEVDAALAEPAPAESKTASADRRPAARSKSHKRGWKHRRHRRAFAWGFIFRRAW